MSIKKALQNVWINNILWIVGLVVTLIVVRTYIFTPVLVSGKSMDPTMTDGERVFATKFDDPKRMDIVTFPAPDDPGKSYIKRVIGLPGERVSYAKGQLYINDKAVDEPYLKEYQEALPTGNYLTTIQNVNGEVIDTFNLQALPGGEETVPAGKLFVLGDNRQNSKDSRIFGYVDASTISGNVKFSFYPFDKFGPVK